MSILAICVTPPLSSPLLSYQSLPVIRVVDDAVVVVGRGRARYGRRLAASAPSAPTRLQRRVVEMDAVLADREVLDPVRGLEVGEDEGVGAARRP